MARFGRIDVLVNNAGYGVVGAIEETSGDEVRRVFETNVFGLLGSDAVAAIEAKNALVAQELAAWRAVAESTDFPR
ncbi:SDR family NAD(P)-dependent oxidoreductase [Sorangium sp. So ce281]